MMGALGRWLTAVICVSLLCALADALMPQGPVKQVGKLVCGLVLLAAVLSPAARLDLSGGERWLEDYFTNLELRKAALEKEVDGQMKSIIEQEFAAYIVDKAAGLGWTCTARVECRESEEGVYLPVRAEVSGGAGEQLAGIIAADLGIPAENITIDKGDAR